MSDAETQGALPPALLEDQPQPERTVIATLVQGTVKWFNVRNGYGFINRNDTKEDVFVHQTAIKKNNPRKFLRSVGDGEIVEFDVVEATKGSEAANVTGPGGVPVKGSRYAPNKRRFRRRFFPRGPRPGQADEGEPPSGPKADEEGGGENDGSVPQPVPRRRRPRRRPDVQGGMEAEEQKNEEVVGGEVLVQQKAPPRRFRPQYRRPFRPRPPPGERVAGQQPPPTVLAEVQARPTEEEEQEQVVVAAQKPGQAEGTPSDAQLVKPRRQFSRRRQRSSESTPSKDGLDTQPAEPDLPIQVIKPPDPKASPKSSPKSSPKMPPKTIKQSEVPATTVTEPSE